MGARGREMAARAAENGKSGTCKIPLGRSKDLLRRLSGAPGGVLRGAREKRPAWPALSPGLVLVSFSVLGY